MRLFLFVQGALLAFAMGATQASAVTVEPDPVTAIAGLTVVGHENPNGNCPSGVGKCWLLTGTSKQLTLTAATGYSFQLSSFEYLFTSGGNPELELFYNGSATSAISLTGNNGVTNIWSAGPSPALTSLVFKDTGNGNVRLGSVDITVIPPIPLPAAGLGLIGAVAMLLGFKARRRTA